jgi:nucleoid DNA-binding protein
MSKKTAKTRKDFFDYVQTKHNYKHLSQSDLNAVLDLFATFVANTIMDDEEVVIRGLGTFTGRKRRISCNLPQLPEEHGKQKTVKKVVVKFSKTLQNKINDYEKEQ